MRWVLVGYILVWEVLSTSYMGVSRWVAGDWRSIWECVDHVLASEDGCDVEMLVPRGGD